MTEEMTIEKAREIAQDLRPERNAIDGILARGFIAGWDQQEARLKIAREALNKHGVHNLECYGIGTKQPHACNCGFNDTLRRIG